MAGLPAGYPYVLCVQAHNSRIWIIASLLTLVFLRDDRVQEKRG